MTVKWNSMVVFILIWVAISVVYAADVMKYPNHGSEGAIQNTINAWHIPVNAEACAYNSAMRNPVAPTVPSDPVCIYVGVYPTGAASTVTLRYKINSGAWLDKVINFTCYDGANEYWWTTCDQSSQWWVPGATYGDTVSYYVRLTDTYGQPTFLYSETSPAVTGVEAVAQADPYRFTYPTVNTATPTRTPTATSLFGTASPTRTPTGTAQPTVNAWHMPGSSEACSYNAAMRNPVTPINLSDPVCIYTGVYPVSGATAVTLYYRINSGAWSSKALTWTCNDGVNDYWWTNCNQPAQWWTPGAQIGDTVNYYIAVEKSGFARTYLYNESSPSQTTVEATAQSNPYHFAYQSITPTYTPTLTQTRTPTPTRTPSGATVPATGSLGTVLILVTLSILFAVKIRKSAVR